LPGKSGNALQKVAENLSKIFMFIGMGMMLIMMFLGGLDVIGRYFFNRPIVGAFEITEILIAGIVFFSLAYTQRVKGHATVGLVYSRLPPRPKTLIGLVNNMVLICLFALISWRGIRTAITQWERHREIVNIGLPSFPFQLFVPAGSLVMCLVLIAEMPQLLNKRRE